MKRIVLAALVIASLSACSYGELLEFVEGSGTGDLSSPENPPDVQAAGSTTEAGDADEQAKEKVAQALDSELGVGTRIGLANDAIQLRPADPRYMIYRAWFNLIAGDDDAAIADLRVARGLADQAYPDDEAERRYSEFYLDATYAVLAGYPAGSNTRSRMEFVYCLAVFKYSSQFGATLLGSAYLDFNAHPELCT